MDNHTPDRNQMTIDQRLEYLLRSTESLHDQLEEFLADNRQQREQERERAKEQEQRMARTEAAERAHRRAIVTAIAAYLEQLGGDI